MKKINFFGRVNPDSRTTVERQSNDGQSQGHYTLGLTKFLFTLLTLLTLGVGQMWADNTHVIAVAGSNPNNYTVKVEANIGDGDTKWMYTFDRAGSITFEGEKLYVGYFNEKYGGVNGLDIHYYNGNTWKSKCTPYGSGWHTDLNDNKVYNEDDCSWYATKTVSVGARVYFQPDEDWTQTSNKIWVGHANYQRYYSMSRVTNTLLYYGTIVTNGWTNAMGIGVVGGTSASDGANYFSNASSNSSEYTGLKNWDVNNTAAGNAYLIVSNGDTGETPTMSYHSSHYSASGGLNYTQTIKYAVGVNGGTPAELTSGYVPANIAISSYKFVSGTYNSVSSSSGSATLSQGGSNYSATVTAARTATTTYTVSNIHEDYSFVGWYSSASGGTLLSSELSYTFYPTSATTAYARFSKENNHTVTISRYCTSTSSEINNTSAKIGEVTYSSIEAPDIHGYTFVNWTLGSGLTKHASDALTANPIRVITAASGTYTLTANYTEVLTTDWKVIGDNTTNSPFGDNYSYASGQAMSKKSGYSATDKAYKTLNLTHTGTWGFKVATASGNSYTYGWGTGSTYITFNRAKSGTANDVYNGEQHELKFNPDGLGEYEFEVDYTTSPCSVKVTFPTVYTVTFGKGTGGSSVTAKYSSVSFTSGTKVQSGKTVTFTQTASTGYQFKEWNTNSSGSGTRLSTSTTYNRTVASTNNVYAIYDPKQYTITLNDQDATTAVSPSTVNATYKSLTLSSAITNPLKTGYTFGGWYSATGGGGYLVINTSGALQASKDGYTDATGWTKTSEATLYAKWTQVLTLDKNGGTTDGSLTVIYKKTATSSHTAATRTGYTLAGYYDASSGGNKIINADGTLVSYSASVSSYIRTDGSWGYNGTPTLYAQWTANSYDVTLKPNGATTGSDQVVRATYDAAMPTTTKTSAALAAPTKTGYTLQGFYQNSDGTGTKYYNANMTSANNWDQAATANVWAKWQANPYTVTLDVDEANKGTIAGATTSQNVTFDGATTTVPNRPTAANGYALDGYYTEQLGEGTKVINGDGTWIASVAGYTDGSKKWVHADDVTLYAYYKKAEITSITFSPGAVVENNSTVSVTATISPTPTGTTCVCWRVLYDNGSALDPQPTFTPASAQGNSVSFTAPNASGMYKVEAKLSTGSTCGAGTLLDTETADFQVAGSHTVTVAYKHSGTDIAASTSVTGRPLEWTEVVTHEIFGYTFSSWTAGDGITIRDTTAARLAELQAVDPTIVAVQRMKAIYNGTLTANYTPKSLIYFKNTLGWSSVYVNFYGNDGYWDDKGSGNKSVTNRNKAMTRIGETDVWYYDYGAASITPTKWVAFTQDSQDNVQNFWASGTGEPVSYPARRADDLADKAGETGFYAATPMFVPLAGQTAITKNEGGGGKALYYNSGYWTKYLPGTGYTLEIYNTAGDRKLKEMDFSSADELMPMKAVADLEGGQTYKFQIKRHGDVYLGNSGTMTYSNHGQSTPWEMTNTDFSMCGITTTAAGDYTFNFTYSANASNAYRLRLSVDYPVANGDYRLVYNDDTRSGGKPSAIIQKENNGSAIVSFFVRKDQHPKLYMQQASVDGAGNITWREYPTTGTPTNQITGDIASAITKDTVYNFNLSMNESGALSVTSAEYYSGNFYIRTDAANSKWDNYRTDPDHLMTYSEYLKSDVGYSHYYTHWVNKDDVGRKNVKFVIANDYSPCISDTLEREEATGTWANIDEFMYEGGDLKRSANVRFMWDIKTNNIARAYIDGAQGPGSNFYLLLLSNDSKIKQGETTKTEVSFADNGNWIYEANVKAQPNAQIKLKSTWGEGTTIVQYFKGSASETETLIGGSGTTWYDIRLLYDFKTNRLVAAYVPATGTISTDNPINADVMFIREHQGDVAQLTFTGSGAISKIQTAYGVLRLNKWTVNNKSTAPGHAPLSPELSRFERDMFYISFPFRVNLEEVFGFGTYGTHWIIEEYDGAGRAANGFWADTPTFWRFITNRKGKFLEPNTGYIVAIDLDKLGESSSVWANTDQVELFFPSYENLPKITSSSVTYELEAHTCTIGPRFPGGDDRRIKDSHWNVMSVPTYINTDDVTFANSTWITAGDGQLGPNFLYTWNMHDNTLSATSGVGYEYKAMHAYIVQYCGNVTWTTSVSPALAPRRNPKAQKDVEFRIELQQNEEMIDRTFVRLSNDEAVTNGFEFNYDLSKEFNKNKANIYTMVTTIMEDGPSVTETAGNCLPMTEQTTVVPMGVMIAKAGEYTISIPSGTSGIGVTLIDNETGIRTNLALEDYTVALEAGTQNDRFYLEISPITHVATDIENTEVGIQNSDVRKVMVDGILYIIKDGKVFSTQGARVK